MNNWTSKLTRARLMHVITIRSGSWIRIRVNAHYGINKNLCSEPYLAYSTCDIWIDPNCRMSIPELNGLLIKEIPEQIEEAKKLLNIH
jgi:hypothetical protein